MRMKNNRDFDYYKESRQLKIDDPDKFNEIISYCNVNKKSNVIQIVTAFGVSLNCARGCLMYSKVKI